MLRRLITAMSFLGVLSSGIAHAQPANPTCDPNDPNCPFRDMAEAVNEAATCGLPVDEAALARFARGNDGDRLSPDEFIALIAPLAQESERETGIPASVTIAQAALETGWGRSARRAANNLFGIKGSGNNGSVRLMTREYQGGRWVRIRARFAAYRRLADSVVAHARLISESGIYDDAMEVKDDYKAFARALQSSGYATDPGYAKKLISIIEARDLARFDDSRECS